jgi:O-acetyl-ADP-ribose deacetylase (regulator of RNase III)
MWGIYSSEERCIKLLQKTFENVLDYANRVLSAESIAMPPIGTGWYNTNLCGCQY